ncbi:hypothetical protein NX059_008903 [Plenodomus lindquistii]|nr:hypothetical protein NX059_008903 [Plenodomus lindquistii]
MTDALNTQTSHDASFDGGNNVPFIWDDCLDVLGNMDDPIYANMMDWDTCESAGSTLTAHLLPTASHVASTSIVPAETGSNVSAFTLPSLSSSATSLVSPSLHHGSASTSTTPSAAVVTGRPQLETTQSAASVPHQRLENVAGTSSSCSCLDKALDLLKDVNKNPCPDPSDTGCVTTQRILAKNKEIIQATLKILACVLCMRDRLLIMISLLITMKMLPRYASAAALNGSDAAPSGEDESTVCTVDQNARRQAKQHVLRELHLVQRLITQLSSRLKSLSSPRRDSGLSAGLLDRQPVLERKESNDFVQKATIRNNSIHTVCGEAQLTPISDRTLDLVETDVRNSLSSLSASVRNALKEC